MSFFWVTRGVRKHRELARWAQPTIGMPPSSSSYGFWKHDGKHLGLLSTGTLGSDWATASCALASSPFRPPQGRLAVDAATDHRHDLLIGLRHPPGAQATGFKGDADFERVRMLTFSTGHDDLLAPGARGVSWVAWP